MRDDQKGSTQHASTQQSNSEGNAFSPRFLDGVRGRDAARRREAGTAPDLRGLAGGPWEVERIVTEDQAVCYAVSRRERPVSDGGGSAAVCGSPADALHLAAVLPAVGARNHLALGPEKPRGLALHDGREFLGHVAATGPAADPALPHYLHLARHLTGDLESLALLHRALGAEALALLGRRLMRRID